MTPEDIKLLGQIFGPQSKLNEVPFAMGDPRAEEERKRQQALYEAERAKSKQTYSQAPLSDRLMATGKGAGFMGGAMLEGIAEPFANLGGGTAEGALSQYFMPKTPVEGAVLSEMANALKPIELFLQDAKVPDIVPAGMLTSSTSLFGDAARQASMGLQKGAKAAARSTEDILRSEFAKAPVGSIKLPETQREPDVNPLGFYSELGRAADSLRQERGTGQQFLSQLRSMPGVKADELKWTGLDDFLSKKDKVTKSEIKDYLSANQVQVEEVRLGDYSKYGLEDMWEAASNTTKFSAHSVPGGKNYRELLLTLPQKLVSKEDISQRMFGKPYTQLTDQERFQVTPEYQKTMGQDFRSSHFDQPNILAHMRVSDFEQDGKKIMLVDEIQSDWGQQGRDKGFAEGLPPGYRAEQNVDGKWVMYNPIGGRFSMVFDTKEAAENAVLSDPRLMGIPKAPFVTSTEGWVNLTLRRAIQEASEKGFDKVAIPVGSVQADRYDLSKQIKAVMFTQPNKDGRMTVQAFDKQDNPVMKGRYTVEEVESRYGKELTQKMLSSTEKKDPRTGMQSLSGVDLKVGGEGMKKFYDQIVPKYLNKLGSKFGTKVTRGTIKDAKGNDVPVHEMTITPQMRESVLKKGQPLFAAVPAVGLTQEEEGYAAGGAIKRAAKAAKKAQKPQVNLEEGFDKFQREANLKKFLEPSKVSQRMYHGSSNPNIQEFKTGKMRKQELYPNNTIEPWAVDNRDAVFLTPNPEFSSKYSGDEWDINVGYSPTTYPVYVQAKNPWDYDNQEHLERVIKAYKEKYPLKRDSSGGVPSDESMRHRHFEENVRELPLRELSNWSGIEKADLQQIIKDLGYDSFYVKEAGVKNLGIYDPRKIKSAIGNRGTYDVTDPDITKAAGGTIKKAAKAAKKAKSPAFGGAYEDSVLRRAKEDFVTTYGMDFGEGLSKDYDFVNINKIKPNEKIEEGRVKKLMDAIQNENPFNTKIPPIIVDSNGNVLDGHHRLEAARRLGIQSVPAIEKFSVQSGLKIIEDDGQGKAAGGAIKKAAKAAKAASKASDVKEQPIYWGMYRGYVGDDVSSTEPQFAAMDRSVAEYYARKRAAQTGLPPHLEMIYKQLDAGRKYGHTVPIDQHNRELLITQAYELQPEDIKGRYQLKKHGGRVKGNI